jgi:hypothetical protein
MAWEEAEAGYRINSNARMYLGVELSCGSPGGGPMQAFLIIRPECLDGAPSWLRERAPISLKIGDGEHAGMVRITPRGAHILRPVGAVRPDGAPRSLRVALPHLSAASTKRQGSCEFELLPGALEVRLPSWHVEMLPGAGRVQPAAPMEVAAMAPPPAPAVLPAVPQPTVPVRRVMPPTPPVTPVTPTPPAALPSRASKMIGKPSEAERPSLLGGSLHTRRAVS